MRGVRSGLGGENDLDPILSFLLGKEETESRPKNREGKATETQGQSTMSLVR